MPTTFAFDVYGTLINPHAIASSLQIHVGNRTAQFSQLWRDKQLEYSFRRGLMGAYQDFSVVTADALNYTCEVMGVKMSDSVKSSLMAGYRTLSAFDDTGAALAKLRKLGCGMYAFSNGLPDDLVSLMKHADIYHHLDGIVSVHDVKSFKPDPRVYEHFNSTTGSDIADTWLVSSNPFDIIGAVSYGWKAAWVQRSPTTVFDPWEFKPTAIINSLLEIPSLAEESETGT